MLHLEVGCRPLRVSKSDSHWDWNQMSIDRPNPRRLPPRSPRNNEVDGYGPNVKKPAEAALPRKPPTDERTSIRLRRQRVSDTAAELAVRSELWRRGLRYRLNYRIPGTQGRADIVFTRQRVAIFVDGCFWHACPLHGTWPKRNSEWWRAKLQANRARDARATAMLESLGWKVLRFWEHEPPSEVAQQVMRAVSDSRQAKE